MGKGVLCLSKYFWSRRLQLVFSNSEIFFLSLGVVLQLDSVVFDDSVCGYFDEFLWCGRYGWRLKPWHGARQNSAWVRYSLPVPRITQGFGDALSSYYCEDKLLQIRRLQAVRS